jgi:hypothetical protein
MQTIRIIVKTFVSLVIVLLCSRDPARAQAYPTVEVPTTLNNSAIVEIPTTRQGDPETNLTMAGEYKSTKNVIEPEKPVCFNWAADIGYESQYNFRGTNLTPDSDGAGFIQAEVSRWGFTLGVFGIHQFGTAHANSFSIGEGGGGGTAAFGAATFIIPNPLPVGPPTLTGAISATTVPETIQDRFNEIDVFFQYQKSFGWIDLTVGNIAFFIDRRATTFADIQDLTLTVFGFGSIPLGDFRFGPFPTVEDEQFDRLYVTLSTSKIPHIQPQITYYQTILNTGTDVGVLVLNHENTAGILPAGEVVPFYRSGERNTALGGYLDGRIKGNFPITNWLSVNPYGVISASFHDRGEPIAFPRTQKEAIRGKSLSGWNAAQAGLELPIHLLHAVGSSSGPCAPADFDFYLTPFVWYSYHISDPTPSTDRDEWWGGAKFTATF